MQINRFSLDPAGSQGGQAVLPPQALGAASLLRDPAAGDLDAQISAYQDLSSQWRASRNLGQRAALAHVLNNSAFGQRVEGAVNSFARAAWPGAEAVPPEPQAKKLEAFDSLSADDQQIVARLQTDPTSGAVFATVADYRASLVSDLDQVRLGRGSDKVTLSPQAQAVLSGGATAAPAEPSPAEPSTAKPDPANRLLVRVLLAYAKASLPNG
ncbi:MAG TPA: hypothetical protein VFN88_07500 [Caulobacteraceae bacterium]|nr:hypothetical protein [Caulobacteraceae bacterium]